MQPLHAPLVCSFHAGKPPGPLHPKTSCVCRESTQLLLLFLLLLLWLRLLRCGCCI